MVKKVMLLVLIIIIYHSMVLNAARVKDITDIEGVRENQLIGYGLVIGLNGTGDDGKKDTYTFKALRNMLLNMGITVSEKDIDSDNIAAVMVIAKLPPFAKPGMKIDAIVSSIGDAKSLQGGILLMTPLKGADGKVYAVAQGPVSIGGYSASGGGGAVGKNFPTTGRIPEGAIIEQKIPFSIADKRKIVLTLKNPDFATCSKIADTINMTFGKNLANPVDSSTINVKVPSNMNVVRFISKVNRIDVSTDTTAKVVLNERTGLVVMGENVTIGTVAVAYGNLSIQIKETPKVSQPAPFSGGKTVTTPQTEIKVNEEKRKLMLINKSISIRDLVRGLNRIGVSSRDLISILQAIKEAGALNGELIIM